MRGCCTDTFKYLHASMDKDSNMMHWQKKKDTRTSRSSIKAILPKICVFFIGIP